MRLRLPGFAGNHGARASNGARSRSAGNSLQAEDDRTGRQSSAGDATPAAVRFAKGRQDSLASDERCGRPAGGSLKRKIPGVRGTESSPIP